VTARDCTLALVRVKESQSAAVFILSRFTLAPGVKSTVEVTVEVSVFVIVWPVVSHEL
jgi:hypothetical protein